MLLKRTCQKTCACFSYFIETNFWTQCVLIHFVFHFYNFNFFTGLASSAALDTSIPPPPVFRGALQSRLGKRPLGGAAVQGPNQNSSSHEILAKRRISPMPNYFEDAPPLGNVFFKHWIKIIVIPDICQFYLANTSCIGIFEVVNVTLIVKNVVGPPNNGWKQVCFAIRPGFQMTLNVKNMWFGISQIIGTAYVISYLSIWIDSKLVCMNSS